MKVMVVAVFLLLLYQNSIFAADNEVPVDEFFEEELPLWDEEELVTATKFSISMRRAPAIATIITDDEIRNSGARDLADVLNRVPGLAVHQNWIGVKTIEVRGINSHNTEKLLFMLNGHRLNVPFFGSAMRIFDDLPLDNIRRIEVVRGPGSALYGANAFSGVVNILTKEAIDNPGLTLTAGAGSFNTKRYNLLYGVERDLLSLSASLSYITTDGDKLGVAADRTTFLDPASSMAPGKTDDWKKKYDFTFNLAAGDFRFDFHHTEKKRGPYIGVTYALNDESDEYLEQTFGHLQYRKVITSNLTMTGNAYIDRFELMYDWEIYPEGFGAGAFPDGVRGRPMTKNRALGTEWQLDYLWGDHFITAGAVYEDVKQYDTRTFANFNSNTGAPLPGGFQEVTGTFDFNRNTDRHIWAFYLQDSWSIREDLTLTLGVRHDNYDDVGSTTNPRVGLVWGFDTNGELKLLYGSAFRAPNFEELYNDNNPAVIGNPSLQPEEVKTYEASISYRFPYNISTTVTYFRNEIEEQIVLNPVTTQFENLGGTDTDGMEAEIKIKLKSHYAYANYSYQHSVDINNGRRIPFTAMHRGNLGLNAAVTPYINFNANLGLVGERRRESGDNRNELPSYVLLDAALVASDLIKNATFKLSGHNLLDKKYQDPSAAADQLPGDYPRDERQIMVEASYYFE